MDITLVGTGVSSLLLAQALLRAEACETLTLVGPRQFLRPHLLSYWSDRPTPFDAFEVASWPALEVSAGTRLLRVPLSRFRYRTIRARPWAEAVLTEVLASGRAQLLEAEVDAIDDDLLRPAVCCGATRLSSDWVFASTPPSHGVPDAWQQFEGWEVELPHPSVETGAARILDFRTVQAADFRFVYALPLAPRRLFVEHVSYQSCDHAAALAEYLQSVVGVDAWRVVDHEGGATPIFRAPLRRSEGRVVHIGVAAGLAKASTGFAAMRMWRDAEAIAGRLASRRDLPLPLNLPSLYRVADRFFVDLLKREPERIPALLGELFAAADGDAVLAFLDEQASPAEQARVAAGMPGWLEWVVAESRA